MLQLSKEDGQAAPVAIRREDYTAPAYWIDSVELTFDLDPAKTRVLNRMTLRRNADVPAQPLRLDGEDLNLARVLVNGQGTAFKMDGGQLQMDVQPLAIVRGDEGLPGKPEPAIFLEAARRIDVPPQHCIVFEDAPFGIEAARRAGMRAVAVCSTHNPAQLAGPHVLAAVRDYTELMNTDFLESIHVATV